MNLGVENLARLAPGARVLIRDEEWLLRSVDLTADGGRLLNCDGVSPLVRGRNALFFTGLEDEIEILDPAQTRLAHDTSSHYDAAVLHIESALRRNIPNDQQIHLGDRAVMNLAPYQLDPALMGLAQPRTRILIADAVGLGKTLEAGILATELIQRGRGKRILVVTLKSMLTQFQKEFWTRFTIPLVRLDSLGLARVRNRIPANHNPFNHFDRVIISIDTLKNNLEYRNHLEDAWWDVIIIDECHNVAARAGEGGIAKRARLARLLATRSDSLILLSATPHDGSARSFASLVALLDPTAISDPDEYIHADFSDKGLVIRRFKKDIRGQVAQEFQERVTVMLKARSSPQEDAAYSALLNIPFTQNGLRQAGRQHELQRVGMQKALFSSPAAALESTARRMRTLERRGNDATGDERAELAALGTFAQALERIAPEAFSKYQRLLVLLDDPNFAWSTHVPADRLVIFSERVKTLEWLKARLQCDLNLSDERIAVLDGSLPDTEQAELVERFGREQDPLRILLCSDVASEGLNLHYFCHRLIHFDLPWSLMVFQQRNGRVDRYGQQHPPRIVYLMTETGVERIKGDLRILEVLQQKDEQVNLSLGDPAAFLNVYDPDRETEKVADFMVQGMSAEDVAVALEAQLMEQDEESDADFLLRLFEQDDAPSPPDATAQIAPTLSLFDDEFAHAETALRLVAISRPELQWSAHRETRTLKLTAPLDLQARLRQLPREAQADNDDYLLCADRARVAQAIEESRQAKDKAWPSLQFLWRQHPVMEWLRDNTSLLFGRHTAPVIRSPRLAAGEAAYLMLGMVPNRKAQPLLLEWQAVIATPGAATRLEPLADFVERSGLKAGQLANAAQHLPLDDLQAGLPAAVAQMRAWLISRQQAFAEHMDQRLSSTLARLEVLQGRQFEQLELRLTRSAQAEQFKRGQREKRSRDIHRVFDEYREWVRDTMTTEPQPFLQVLAVVSA